VNLSDISYKAKRPNTVVLGTLMVIVLLWFVISAPLSAVGSYFGTRHGVSIPAVKGV
jgi:hypothetical protein